MRIHEFSIIVAHRVTSMVNIELIFFSIDYGDLTNDIQSKMLWCMCFAIDIVLNW